MFDDVGDFLELPDLGKQYLTKNVALSCMSKARLDAENIINEIRWKRVWRREMR
jgi:hypothetical protein